MTALHVPAVFAAATTAQTIEACELFCLHRTKFREMLALSVNSSLVQRFAWIKAIPELVRDEMLEAGGREQGDVSPSFGRDLIPVVRRGKQSPRQRTVLYLVTTPKRRAREYLFCVV